MWSTWTVGKDSETPGRKSNPPSDHCKKGWGQIITQASSLIQNETFRYQVKFLALSKAQMKVLCLPCPLLGPRRGYWSSNSSSKSRASLLRGLVYPKLFLNLPTGSRGQGPNPWTTWKDPRAGKKALYVTFPTWGRAGPRISHPEELPSPHSQRGRTVSSSCGSRTEGQ